MAGTSQIKPAPSLEAFASPDQLDPKLQSFLEDACTKLCKWFASAEKRGPLPEFVQHPEVAPKLEGLSTEALMADLQLIMDGAYHPSHPGALAHLDPPPLIASVVGDLICAGLNNNLLAHELSPSLSSLEKNLCHWFAERLGMPSRAGGVAASGGSLSNLMALVVARFKANLQNDSKAVVFASNDAHISLSKAIRVMGLSSDSLQTVSTDINGQMNMQDLECKLSLLRSQGRKCFAVVATAGTTVRGAIDPIFKISEFCKREGLWLHVDGAIGGVFSLAQSTTSLLEGISLSDSVTLNPQKLLGITKTSSLLLVANREDLTSTFGTGLPYIEPTVDDEINGGEYGLQGSRPAEVLKLWLGLRQLGETGITKLIESSISRRSYFENKLDFNNLNVKSGPLHLIAFTPKNIDITSALKWSNQTRKKLLAHKFMLSRPMYEGRYHLKVVTGNPHTMSFHLDQLLALVNQSTENI